MKAMLIINLVLTVTILLTGTVLNLAAVGGMAQTVVAVRQLTDSLQKIKYFP